MRNIRGLVLVTALALPIAGAQAVTFSNFLIDGVAPGAGNPTTFGPNGVSFSIPKHFLVGVGVKTLTIDYRVDAAAGMLLDTFSMFPVGTSKNGSVAIDVTHSNAGSQTFNYLYNGGASSSSLPSQTNINLAPKKEWYDVRTIITLTGGAANAVNTVSIYSVSYTEAVPEPASLSAIALGFGTLLARRARRKK